MRRSALALALLAGCSAGCGEEATPQGAAAVESPRRASATVGEPVSRTVPK